MIEADEDCSERIVKAGLKIDMRLHDFVGNEVIPGTGIDEHYFWTEFANFIARFAPENQALLTKRDRLQSRIDQWHKDHPGLIDPHSYQTFLMDIGYLLPSQGHFSIDTTDVDNEVAMVAGPQLVVPVNNARFALNACNARWGSLYDALYGSDVIEPQNGYERSDQYNPKRGAEVIEFGRNFLDSYFPLVQGNHADAIRYQVRQGSLIVSTDKGESTLVDNTQFVGYCGADEQPTKLLLKNHGLHLEIYFDAQHPIGRADLANISDIVLESALTTIMDCEDSVAAVDCEDKIQVYRNWLGLMRGTLRAEVHKNQHTFSRIMHPDRSYTSPSGESFTLPGRSLMLIRNVGLHMSTSAVLNDRSEPIPEGLLDVAITSLIALHDLRHNSEFHNSACGNIYIVKPKLHGPEEVAFTDRVFAATETLLRLPINTLKLGVMDEERRTSVNLGECIRAAKSRLVFINTGFLDRTADEIHTSMAAGAIEPKNQLKIKPWMDAYEQNNVTVGLLSGLRNRAQIGKGMWPKPDNLQEMLIKKVAHPLSGASTAWVPSPTAATLHTVHYHEVDVRQQQMNLLKMATVNIEDMLQIPLLQGELPSEDVQQELENNIQSILGYVVHWIDRGIGCSKVLDRNNVPLMEDRATLRIASQHIGNWLCHGVVTEAQIDDTLATMARIVDQQNADNPGYHSMHPNLQENIAYRAARDLIRLSQSQPNGYTESLLHKYRRQAKASKPHH